MGVSFSHGFSFEGDGVGVVDQSVKNGVVEEENPNEIGTVSRGCVKRNCEMHGRPFPTARICCRSVMHCRKVLLQLLLHAFRRHATRRKLPVKATLPCRRAWASCSSV